MPEATIDQTDDLLVTREQVRAYIDAAVQRAVASGEITPDEAETEGATALAAANARIAELEAQARTNTMSLPGSGDADAGSEGPYSLSAAVRGLALRSMGEGNWRSVCPREAEMSDQLNRRDHGSISDPSLGFAIPAEVHKELFEKLLKPRVVAFQLGVRRISATGVPLIIPHAVETVKVDNVAENERGNRSIVKWGEMHMTPKSQQAEVRMSRDLLSSADGAEAYVREEIADEMGRQINYGIMKGAGGPNEMVGLLNTPGIIPVNFGGVAIGPGNVPSTLYAAMLAMKFAPRKANATQDGGSWKWTFPSEAMHAFEQIRSTGGTGEKLEMARKVLDSSDLTRILGFGFEETNMLNAGDDTEMIYGNFAKGIYAEWGGVRIEASNVAEDCMAKNQTLVIARSRGDFGVTQPKAFAHAVDFNLSPLTPDI